MPYSHAADGPNADPFIAFRFTVSFDNELDIAGFQKVSGLSEEVEEILYRLGSSPPVEMKLPGLIKTADVTLEKGLDPNQDLYKWFHWVHRDPTQSPPGRRSAGKPGIRKDVVVTIKGDDGKPKLSWKLTAAFPKKYEVDDLDAGTSAVAVERVTLAHEGFSLVRVNGRTWTPSPS